MRATSEARRRTGDRHRPAKRRWSQRVTRTSNALDLDAGVFTLRSSKAVAASLRRSLLRSRRRKASPFQSALSMLTFYINRAGRTLPPGRRRVLEGAKQELRTAFSRDGAARGRTGHLSTWAR